MINQSFYANVIIGGVGLNADFIEPLCKRVPLNLLVFESLIEKEDVQTDELFVKGKSILRFIKAGFESTLSIIRSSKREAVLSCALFVKKFDNHFLNQISNSVNFSMFDSSLVEIEDFNNFYDLNWVRGRPFRKLIMASLDQQINGEITYTLSLDSKLALLNLGWLIGKFLKPFSLESKTRDKIVLHSKNASLKVMFTLDPELESVTIRSKENSITINRRVSSLFSSTVGQVTIPKSTFDSELNTAILNPGIFLDYVLAKNLVKYLFDAHT